MLKIGTITINKRQPAIKANYYISLFILIFTGIAVISFFDVPYYKCGLSPTDTFVKTDMEDVKHKLDKKAWLDMVHSSSETTNWQVVEAKNRFNKYQRENNSSPYKFNGNISVAGGKLTGQWLERGSNNQAGSVTHTAYDSYNKKLYVLSAGGSLWKGDINGLNWEVFNDQLRFDDSFLSVINRNDTPSIILASINGIPHIYKNEAWSKANGFHDINYLETKDLCVINQGQEIFFLAQESKTSPVGIYYSDNYGSSFSKLRNFNTTQLHKVGLAGNQSRSELFIIEQATNIRSKIYKWKSSLSKLDLVNANSSIDFGPLGNANIQLGNQPGELYLHDSKDAFLRTLDFGQNWQTLTQLPVTPWSTGVFISPSNPNKFLLPNVEAYRSSNRGESWEKVNDWMEYYENPSVKLHADIMHIAEYKEGSQNFIIVANHGGLSISYNNGQNFSNIGFNHLNIGQYYSAKNISKGQ